MKAMIPRSLRHCLKLNVHGDYVYDQLFPPRCAVFESDEIRKVEVLLNRRWISVSAGVVLKSLFPQYENLAGMAILLILVALEWSWRRMLKGHDSGGVPLLTRLEKRNQILFMVIDYSLFFILLFAIVFK